MLKFICLRGLRTPAINIQTFPTFIKSHAKELSDEVINRHIGLYVNNFSFDLGEKGKKAIRFLYEKGEEAGIFRLGDWELFVE